MEKLLPKFIRSVLCNAEYCDDYPPFALMEITPKLYKWILKAVQSIKSLGATYIQKFEYTPDWMESESGEPIEADLKDWENDEHSSDYSIITVSDDFIKWEMCIRHTDTTCETEHISLKALKECFKVLKADEADLSKMKLEYEEAEELREKRQVLNTNEKNLPLLLEHLKFDGSKTLLQKRLANGTKK